MASLPTTTPTSLSSSVPTTPHGVDPTKVPSLQDTDDPMAEILVQMENVLKITIICQLLTEFLCTCVGNIAVENRPTMPAPIAVPNLTIEQCDEPMASVLDDSCKIAFWGVPRP